MFYEADDVFPGQHTIDAAIAQDGQLVDAVLIHFLDGFPQPGGRVDLLQFIQRQHRLRHGGYRQSLVWDFANLVQGQQADDPAPFLDNEAAPAAA